MSSVSERVESVRASGSDAPRERGGSGTAELGLGARAYWVAARACLPGWVGVLDPPPWLAEAVPRGDSGRSGAAATHARVAAALGMAALAEAEGDRFRAESLEEYVRTALIAWQLGIRRDGSPHSHRVRSHPLRAAIAWCVTTLVRDFPRTRNDQLLRELEAHLVWLARHHEGSPWLEASAVSAIADGGALLTNEWLVRRARHRLHRLLGHQDAEGWFAERGGADAGRLSLLIDAFARLHRFHGREELARPIEGALGFLLRVVHPDGSVGACAGSCETGFVSPYGAELLGPAFSSAAGLAGVCRRAYSGDCAVHATSWHYYLGAVLGSRLALAARSATATLAECEEPVMAGGEVHFPRAGLSVYSTDAYHAVVAGRKGGALHVHWRRDAAALDDPGITVVGRHVLRTSGTLDARTLWETEPGALSSKGTLRRVTRNRGMFARLRPWLRFQRLNGWWRRIFGLGARAPRLPLPVGVRSRFRRRITFGDDWITVADEVRGPRRAKTVICGCAGRLRPNVLRAGRMDERLSRPPVFVEARQHVTITRVYRHGKLLDTKVRASEAPALSAISDLAAPPRR